MGDLTRRYCLQCGGTLPDGSPHNRKFCSTSCKSKYAYDAARGPLPDKNCLHCGTLMPEAPLRKKYCSDKCRQDYNNNKVRSDKPTPVCAHCGVDMPGAARHRKYCSDRCKARAYVLARLEAAPTPTCAWCGKDLPKPSKPGEHRKFCDVQCREKNRYATHRESRLARNKQWIADNPERVRELRRKYRQENLEAYKARDRARYLRKREEILKQAKDYYEKNREEAKARVAAYLEKKRQDPEWVAKERERARQKWHKASEKQKEAWRRRGQRRQSRKNLQRVGEVSAADWDAILRIWDHSCAYCGTRLEYNEHGNLIVDIEHIIPISRGGPHSVGNLVPSCEGCNHRKSTKLLVEWRYSKRGQARIAKGPLKPSGPVGVLP